MRTPFQLKCHLHSPRRSAVCRAFLVAGALFVIHTNRPQPARGDDRPEKVEPPRLAAGPQLFLDDEIVDKIDGLTRRVFSPERLAEPVLDSKTFGVTQPYVSVVRDRATDHFRIWYNHGPAVWQAESADGIRWSHPRVAWDLDRCYGASLIDDIDRGPDPSRRYKMANWQAVRGREKRAGDGSGMYIGFSPDGLAWTAYDKNPVLPGVGDIIDVFYDPLARRYGAAVKLSAVAADGYKAAPRAGKAYRRLVGMSVSKDFVHWEKPWRIFVPDARDEGTLEFYGMGAVHFRGSLAIGLVRVLRDDLACDPGGPKNGIGYAVLATSRDGIKWHRYREPFLNRSLAKGAWDHAMTWISFAIPVGDQVYFYYGGYARGHKIEPGSERQIGLARMKKDRYVGLTTADEGKLVTRPFDLPSGRLTINADAAGGEIRVRLLNVDGQPIPNVADAEPIHGDVLAGEVRWPEPPTALRGKPVRLEFRVSRSTLFGFEFHEPSRDPS